MEVMTSHPKPKDRRIVCTCTRDLDAVTHHVDRFKYKQTLNGMIWVSTSPLTRVALLQGDKEITAAKSVAEQADWFALRGRIRYTLRCRCGNTLHARFNELHAVLESGRAIELDDVRQRIANYAQEQRDAARALARRTRP